MRLLDRVRKLCKELNTPSEAPGSETKLIIADPVWAEIDAGPNKVWKNTDFPNVAPPFPSFFIEAQSAAESRYWCGIWFQDFTEQAAQYKTTLSGELPPGTRWVVKMNGYTAFEPHVLTNFPGVAFIHVGEHGEWLDDPQMVNLWMDDYFRGLTDKQVVERGFMSKHDFMNCIPFAFTTLSLMHCRNVSMEETTPQVHRVQRRRFERETGQPLSKYYVLKIKPRTPRSTDSIHGSEQAVGLNREHIARGHFKTYEPPGLFGRWVGTYWWSDMVRGNPERGNLDKAYKVEPDHD